MTFRIETSSVVHIECVFHEPQVKWVDTNVDNPKYVIVVDSISVSSKIQDGQNSKFQKRKIQNQETVSDYCLMQVAKDILFVRNNEETSHKWTYYFLILMCRIKHSEGPHCVLIHSTKNMWGSHDGKCQN